jgi:hypothetical protein
MHKKERSIDRENGVGMLDYYDRFSVEKFL